MPTAISCRVGYDAHRHSFEARWQLLRRLAALVSASDARVRFEPPTPECCHAHCYLRAHADVLDAARDAALRETGVRVYRRLRGEGVGEGGSECYFEWVIGPEQLGLSDELVLGAWAAFLRALPT